MHLLKDELCSNASNSGVDIQRITKISKTFIQRITQKCPINILRYFLDLKLFDQLSSNCIC